MRPNVQNGFVFRFCCCFFPSFILFDERSVVVATPIAISCVLTWSTTVTTTDRIHLNKSVACAHFWASTSVSNSQMRLREIRLLKRRVRTFVLLLLCIFVCPFGALYYCSCFYVSPIHSQTKKKKLCDLKCEKKNNVLC